MMARRKSDALAPTAVCPRPPQPDLPAAAAAAASQRSWAEVPPSPASDWSACSVHHPPGSSPGTSQLARCTGRGKTQRIDRSKTSWAFAESRPEGRVGGAGLEVAQSTQMDET
eukprot:5104028-Pleurochrysis_carterae.AAC.3